jgi:hypothetical protein
MYTVADPYITTPENARRIWDWLTTRGGILHWHSVDLSDPGWSMATPATDSNGAPTAKPHWKAGNKPELQTDASAVVVTEYKEVKRFHVAIRRSSNGLSEKLTDASAEKLCKAIRRASKPDALATYHFDYWTQEAVILAPTGTTPLAEFIGKDKTQ